MPNTNGQVQFPVPDGTGDNDGDEYPFDKAKMIRPGVRYAQADFPFGGKFALPDSATGGTISDYDELTGPMKTPNVSKNMKKE